MDMCATHNHAEIRSYAGSPPGSGTSLIIFAPDGAKDILFIALGNQSQ